MSAAAPAPAVTAPAAVSASAARKRTKKPVDPVVAEPVDETAALIAKYDIETVELAQKFIEDKLVRLQGVVVDSFKVNVDWCLQNSKVIITLEDFNVDHVFCENLDFMDVEKKVIPSSLRMHLECFRDRNWVLTILLSLESMCVNIRRLVTFLKTLKFNRLHGKFYSGARNKATVDLQREYLWKHCPEMSGLEKCCVCLDATITKTRCGHTMCYGCWRDHAEAKTRAGKHVCCPLCRACIAYGDCGCTDDDDESV